MIRTIDGILKEIEGPGPGPGPVIPGERDLFQTAVLGLLAGGIILGAIKRGDKK